MLSDSSDKGRGFSPVAAATPPPKFSIDLYSDTICPWCYIGRKHLDRAISLFKEQNPDAEFSFAWKPFVLIPNAKVAERSKKSPFVSRLGPKAPAFFDRLAAMAADYGIEFEWEGTTGNSRDSHKLILLAMDQDIASQAGKSAMSFGHPAPSSYASPAAAAIPHSPHTQQNAVIEQLSRGMFEQGRDVSDRGFLVEVALELGLAANEAEVLAWLDGAEANARVDAEVTKARAIGINGVPTFVVNGRYRVGGMQEPGIFLGLFDKIRAKELGYNEEVVVVGEMAKGTMAMRRSS